MTAIWAHPRVVCYTLLTAALFLVPLGLTRGQGSASPNEREVKSEASALDDPKLDVWALDFRFKDPRLIKVNIPGRGTRICWYMWYQVINRTKEPRTFIPDFELVTLDKNTVHHDQVLPKVQDSIKAVEDPTDYYKIKNSVTTAAEPIPVSRENATPRPVTGVAIWDNIDPDANSYSIFVAGLSNGWSVTDPVQKDGAPVVRRKTLQLSFKRLGDRYYQRSEEIHFQPPAKWIYRGSELKVPGLPAPAAKP